MKRILLAACAALAGCAAEPVPYHSGNEIPRGPGLLTGAEGEFVWRAGADANTTGSAPRNADEERDYREWREQRRREGAGKPAL